jgi:hypothetical protein
MVATAVQAKQNDRRSRFDRALRERLVSSTIEHGPIHRDASVTQFSTPFFAPSLVMFMSHICLCGINHMNQLEVRSHLAC